MAVTSLPAEQLTRPTPSGPAPGLGPVWFAAGTLSGAAGLIHAAAAGSHASLRMLSLGFAVTALLQLGWSVAVAARPGRGVAAAGLVLNAGAVTAWAVTRLTATGLVEGLEERQTVGLQDATVVAFEVAAIAAVAAALSGRRLSRQAGTAIATLALVGALPAVAVGHDHSHGEAGRDGTLAVGAAAHDHTAADDPAEAPSPEPDVLAGLGLTDPQRARAEVLIAETKRELARYSTVEAAEAAGFRSIGDGFTGFEHFVQWTYLGDGAVLDPSRPESLVYRVQPDGTRVLESAMYILLPGQTTSDVPTDVGPAELWHDHQDLCWGPDQRLAGRLVDGRCVPGGVHVVTPPMLHVWIVDHVCGPFAGIEGGRIPTTVEECPSHSH